MKLFELKFDNHLFIVYSSKIYSHNSDGNILSEGPYVIVGSDDTCFICESLNDLHFHVTDDIIDCLIDPLPF